MAGNHKQDMERATIAALRKEVVKHLITMQLYGHKTPEISEIDVNKMVTSAAYAKVLALERQELKKDLVWLINWINLASGVTSKEVDKFVKLAREIVGVL